MYRTLKVNAQDQVGDLVLAGQSKGNAMGPDFWREFPQAVKQLSRTEGVRVIVVRTEGPQFTYGLDLPAMMGELMPLLQGGDAAARTALHNKVLELQEAFNSLANCPQPVIAAVNGWCIGGGVDLITACDIRLCSADARFSVREVKVAMVADLGTLQRLPLIVGQGHAKELALTGKDIDAQRALRIGLVNDVYDSQQSLFEAAFAMAKQIAQNPPLVVQGVKQVIDAPYRASVNQGLAHVAVWNSAFLPSQDLAEAMAAFMEKRPAVFQGK